MDSSEVILFTSKKNDFVYIPSSPVMLPLLSGMDVSLQQSYGGLSVQTVHKGNFQLVQYLRKKTMSHCLFTNKRYLICKWFLFSMR